MSPICSPAAFRFPEGPPRRSLSLSAVSMRLSLRAERDQLPRQHLIQNGMLGWILREDAAPATPDAICLDAAIGLA